MELHSLAAGGGGGSGGYLRVAPTEGLAEAGRSTSIEGPDLEIQHADDTEEDSKFRDVEAMLKGTSGAGVWAAESNLDEFFTRMYRYYYQRGFPSILASHITSLITLAFTVIFSTFLLVFVDWPNLLTCGVHDTTKCMDLATYLKWDVLVNPNLFHRLVFGYFFLFSGYWVITLLYSIPTLAQNWRMYVFYRDRLKITTRDLQTMAWPQVVAQFDALHRSGEYRVQLNNRSSVSAFHIAARVMRKDNYLIALINKNVLDLRLPCCGCAAPFTKSLEWNLHWTLLNHMFSRNFRLRPQFLTDVTALQRRFVMFGLLNLVLLPFTLLFMVMYFFLKNAEEFHKKGDYLGPRKWSPLALWKFREFNELPHVFDRRINGSYKPANEYELQFPTPVLAVVAKCMAFVAGSMAAVLLALALVDEELLLHIHILDRNLLWYIAIFSGILAISRAFIPTPEQSVLSPDRAMRKLVAYLHYMPKRWRGRFNTYDVRDEFLELYQVKVVLFLQEILGTITTPLLLLFAMPRRAHHIIEFVKRVSVTQDNLGSMCGYALFDLRKFGNAKYGAPRHASKLWRSRQGKMEKSLLSFQANYPEWSAESDGVELLQMLTHFQAAQSAAITGRGIGMGMGMSAAAGMIPAGRLGPGAMEATGYMGHPGATAPIGVPGWGIGSSGFVRSDLDASMHGKGVVKASDGAASLNYGRGSGLNAFGSALGASAGRWGVGMSGSAGHWGAGVGGSLSALRGSASAVGVAASRAKATGVAGSYAASPAGGPAGPRRVPGGGWHMGGDAKLAAHNEAAHGGEAAAHARVPQPAAGDAETLPTGSASPPFARAGVDGATGDGSGLGSKVTDPRAPSALDLGRASGSGAGAGGAGMAASPAVPADGARAPTAARQRMGLGATELGFGASPAAGHIPLPGSPPRVGKLLGARGLHAGRAMTGEFVWNPYEPLSAQSLLLPLGALTPAQQENHFFWLDRFYEAHADTGAAPSGGPPRGADPDSRV